SPVGNMRPSTISYFPRNFRSFLRAGRCVLRGAALVRVELVLNSRLPQLTRVSRELRMARFTDSPRRNVADSLQDPKTALGHGSSLPHPRKLRHSWMTRVLQPLAVFETRETGQKTEHFPCSTVIAPISAVVKVFHYAAETLADS